MKKKFNSSKAKNTILLIVIFSSIVMYAFSTGITGRTLKNGDGCTCHNQTPSSNVNVVISGPDELEPNATGTFMVTVTGGPLTAAGTNIAASEGILSVISNSGLRKENGELTHIQPKQPSGGSVTFQFEYTAPGTEGEITLFANGNSVNLNGQNSGDEWNFAANKIVSVMSATGVDDEKQFASSYRLKQNYPNPFNPSTQIGFVLADNGYVNLTVYNSLGDEVATLVDGYRTKGDYTYTFDASNLASGVYFYTITTEKYVETKKMLLLR